MTMTEASIAFSADGLKLEGLLHSAPGARGVVISHPHPLYGGNLYNSVVETIARAYQHTGYTTLRFNFRSVGNSQGEHDHGRGEQQDVVAALQYLAGQGKADLDLAGYSFGAWVNALAQPPPDTVQRMLMVSPPVAFIDFHAVPPLPQLKLVIAASQDAFGPPALIETLLPRWNPDAPLEVIEGADHFYGGYIRQLAAVLAAYLETER